MNLNNIVPQNEVEPLPHESEEIAARADEILRAAPKTKRSAAVQQALKEHEDGHTAADLQPAVPFDSFDWEQLCGDVMTLRVYGEREYSAVQRVFEAFRYEFIARLHKELKKQSRAQWKQETFDRLKKEFAQE
jgi:hypothetical protein